MTPGQRLKTGNGQTLQPDPGTTLLYLHCPIRSRSSDSLSLAELEALRGVRGGAVSVAQGL